MFSTERNLQTTNASASESYYNLIQSAGETFLNPDQDLNKPIGFPVTTKKFWIMNIFTLGIYRIWWAAKNFQAFAIPNKNRFFNIFFGLCLSVSLIQLLKALAKSYTENNLRFSLNILGLAIAFFTADIIIRASFDKPIWIAMFLDTLLLSRVQKAILELNRQVRPNAIINSKFSLSEVVLCSVGGLGLLAQVAKIIVETLHKQ